MDLIWIYIFFQAIYPALAYETQVACERQVVPTGGARRWERSLHEPTKQYLFFTGGIITAEDLRNYTVSVSEPLRIRFSDGAFALLTSPPPSSGGVIAGLILKVLSGEFFRLHKRIDKVAAA